MEPVFRAWYERKMLATPELIDETNRVRQLLKEIKTVAIVGISKDQHKDSHYVGRYLKNAGYKIVPVNPSADEILGERCYKALKEIPFPVDTVDVFRKAADLPGVLEETREIGSRVFWIQLGIHPGEETLRRADEIGITLIKHRCMKVDHQFLMRTPHPFPPLGKGRD